MEIKDEFVAEWIQGVYDKGFEQIQKELFDYCKMMDVYSKVLDLVTNGKMSKTNYTYEAIEEVYRETQKEIRRQDLLDSQSEPQTNNSPTSPETKRDGVVTPERDVSAPLVSGDDNTPKYCGVYLGDQSMHCGDEMGNGETNQCIECSPSHEETNK